MNTDFKSFKKPNPLLIITVLIPTAIAILYYGLIASAVYVSESKFIVRSPNKEAGSGLSVLLRGTSFSGSNGNEGFAVQDYIQSRDALRTIERDKLATQAYTRQNIDFVNRFNNVSSDDTFESLFKYFGSMLRVQYDATSSITTLKVRAYTAQDAYQINKRLLEQSEALVNRINRRGRMDLIRYALIEVENAERDAKQSAAALAAYRNNQSLIDPERQAPAELQGVMGLQQSIITARTRLFQLRRAAPGNPQIATVQNQLSALEREYAAAMSKVAGGQTSLAGAAANYQRLALENQFAERKLAGALTTLTDAQNEARRKQVYLERVVEPNMPDKAVEPRRIRGIISTLALGLVAWGILSMLLAGLFEHKD